MPGVIEVPPCCTSNPLSSNLYSPVAPAQFALRVKVVPLDALKDTKLSTLIIYVPLSTRAPVDIPFEEGKSFAVVLLTTLKSLPSKGILSIVCDVPVIDLNLTGVYWCPV